MMNNISVLGLGKVGTLVATLLAKRFKVTGVDKQEPHYSFDLPFDVVNGDVSSESFLSDLLIKMMPSFLHSRTF